MNRPAAPIGSDDRTQAPQDGVTGRLSRPQPGPSGGAQEAPVAEMAVTAEWLREQIERLERRLARLIETGRADDDYIGIPKSGPIRIVIDPVTFRRRTFREVLEDDLKVMREALGLLVAGAARAGVAQAHRQARAWTGKFDKDLAALLREAAKTGQLDLDGLHEIQAVSDAAVRAWTQAVRTKPTPGNIRGLLDQVAHSQLAGLDDSGADGGPMAEAWEVLEGAGTVLVRAAEERFRASPSADNMLRFARAAEQAQLLGGDGAIGQLPDGVRRLGSEDTCVVGPGDTLSGLSLRYYGSEGYWDVIYFANAQAIGDDPNHLPRGTALRIPG